MVLVINPLPANAGLIYLCYLYTLIMTFNVVTRKSFGGKFTRPVAATVTMTVADQRAWTEYYRSFATTNLWRDDK
jgi:hypothetical protein